MSPHHTTYRGVHHTESERANDGDEDDGTDDVTHDIPPFGYAVARCRVRGWGRSLLSSLVSQWPTASITGKCVESMTFLSQKCVISVSFLRGVNISGSPA
jgi:hypothetical protein